MHDFLYADYLLDRDGEWEAVSDLIVADTRNSLGRGALSEAADLLIVLRRLLLKRLRMAPVRCLYSSRGPAFPRRVSAHAPVELRARMKAGGSSSSVLNAPAVAGPLHASRRSRESLPTV